MSTPMRVLNGIATVDSADPLGQLPFPDPTKYATTFLDFCGGFLGAASVNNTTTSDGGYSVVASANMTVSVVTDTGGKLGCLKAVTGAADNENVHVYTFSPGFVMTAGKKFFMETSFEITATNVEQNELFIGLATNQTTTNFFAADGTARTFDDGIGWYSIDGATDISLIVGENDVFDSVDVVNTYVTATWYKLSCYFDGTNLYYYKDDVCLGYTTPGQIPVSVIGPAIWFKSGEAAAHQLLVDYLYVAAER